MKNYGLLLTTILLVGCGGSGDSSPASDGKGNIDVVSYLPAISMEKSYSGGADSPIFIGLNRISVVTVIDNKIIEDNIQSSTIHGIVSENAFQVTTTYNDESISVEYSNGKATEYRYRHVDNNELKSNTSKNYSYDYINNEYDIVVGKIEHTDKEKCVYKNINAIEVNNKIVSEGDFLAIECKKTFIKTYHIDNTYIDLDKEYKELNNKKEIVYSSKIDYYKKGIGFFGLVSNDNSVSDTYLLLQE